jgi:LPXTG-motif cell wall-anchored protein
MPLCASFFTSLLLVQAAPPTVAEATSEFADGRLTIEAVTSEPLPRHDVRSKLAPEGLVLYLQDVLIASPRAFERSEGRTVNGLPRSDYTKLVVPLPDLRCNGPIQIEVNETRVRASVRCTPRGQAAATTAPSPGRGSSDRRGWRPLPSAPPVAATPPPAPPAPTAPRAPATPATVAAPAAAASAPAPTTPPPAPAPTTPPAAPPAAQEAASLPAAPAAATAAVRAGGTSEPRPGLHAAPATGGIGSAWALTVAGLAVGASIFLLWRRRQRHGGSLIRILESASLGPRRALVVAEIEGQKIILGTSEAGIALLSPLTNGTGIAVADLRPPASEDPILITEETPGPTPGGEKGFLSRLFSRRREEPFFPEEEGPSTMAEDFRDLLEDSLDDDELRRRLQAGIGSRKQ